jgi:TolB-like protein/Tfp pilus assembly protein PilF
VATRYNGFDLALACGGCAVRIGEFELDPARYVLSRGGRAIKLERLPMELLILLVEQRGRMVTRDEIVERLWGKDKFLDVDNSINTAIRKLRTAFRDSPERSSFIKTITGKGYRFVAPVDIPADSVKTPETKRRVMLAVLPFENLSGDPEQEYFADGLTEETICYLGQMDPARMGVIARTSSMAYKRTTRSIAQIGCELGVDFVLESSVRRQGTEVRITSQLIRVDDQTHLWADRYDRDATHVMSVQNELGKAIAGQVQAKLIPESRHARRAQTHDVDAYDLYLRGRYYFNQLNRTGFSRAIGYFEQAVARDPDYALAYVGLAETYAILPINCEALVPEIHPQALAAAAKAVQLDPTLAEGHAASGAVKAWMEWDWEGAETSLQRAIALNPSYVHAHRMYAIVLSATGRHRESAAQMKKARELDPLSPLMHGLSGGLMYVARKDDLAIGYLRDALAINPNLWVLHLWIAKSYEREGMLGEAIEEYQKAFDLSGGNTEAFALKACTQAQAGNRAEAHRALRFLIESAAQRYVPPYNIALIFAGLGDDENALGWLEKAYQSRDARLIWVAMESKWDCLRGHGQFQSLLRRLSLPLEIVPWSTSAAHGQNMA